MGKRRLRLWVVVDREDHGRPGGWHPVLMWPCSRGRTIEAVHAFPTEGAAWLFLLGDDPSESHERAMRTAWAVVEFGAAQQHTKKET